MTEFSKALVEKVARAIADPGQYCGFRGDLGMSEWQARAALTASGLDEAIEALEPFAKAAEHYLADHDDNEIHLPGSYAAGKDDFAPIMRGVDFRRARTLTDKLKG